MRLLITIGIASLQSTTSSSSGSAEDFVFVPLAEELEEADFVVIPSSSVKVLTTDLSEDEKDGATSPADADVVRESFGNEIFKSMKTLLANPSTRIFLKNLAQGYNKSLLGRVTPPLKDAHLFILENRNVLFPLIVILILVYNDPILRNQLFKAGIPQYFIHDAVWSSLSNGAIPEISNLVGLYESLASFASVGLPVSLFGTNWKTYQFTFALLNFLKGFNELVSKKQHVN